MSTLVEARNLFIVFSSLRCIQILRTILCIFEQNLRKEKEEVENNLFKKLSKKDALCEELEATVTDLKAQIQVHLKLV